MDFPPPDSKARRPSPQGSRFPGSRVRRAQEEKHGGQRRPSSCSIPAFHEVHPASLSHRPRITGDRMMRNTAGKMKKTRGNSIFTAACWAIVSARCPWRFQHLRGEFPQAPRQPDPEPLPLEYMVEEQPVILDGHAPPRSLDRFSPGNAERAGPDQFSQFPGEGPLRDRARRFLQRRRGAHSRFEQEGEEEARYREVALHRAKRLPRRSAQGDPGDAGAEQRGERPSPAPPPTRSGSPETTARKTSSAKSSANAQCRREETRQAPGNRRSRFATSFSVSRSWADRYACTARAIERPFHARRRNAARREPPRSIGAPMRKKSRALMAAPTGSFVW